MNEDASVPPELYSNNAVAYIVFPGDARRPDADMADDLSIARQREAIEQKAKEKGWEIVHEFTLPKKANHIKSPEFRAVLEYVELRNVKNVIIYRQLIHRDHVKCALIEATLMRVGARVVSIHDTEGFPEKFRGILRAVRSFDTLTRHENQMRAVHRRRREAA